MDILHEPDCSQYADKAALTKTTNRSPPVFESAKATFGLTVTGLDDLQWEQLRQAVLDCLKAHPGTSAFQLACLLAFTVPSLIAKPSLLSLGFGVKGPIG